MVVCSECGSQVSYRSAKVATLVDEVAETHRIPYNCTNAKCLNANPRHHDFDWYKIEQAK